MADYNTAPRGANSGAAVVLTGGNDSLKWLQNQEKLQAAIGVRKAADAARATAASEKELTSWMKLSTKGAAPFEPMLQQAAQTVYAGMKAVMTDNTLSHQDKAIKLAGLRNEYDRKAQASEAVASHLQTLGDKITDKRFDKQKAIGRLNQTLVDAQGQRVNPLDYDTQHADDVLSSPDIFDKQQVWSQFAKDAVQKDSEAYERAARAGAPGLKTYWEGSQLVERDPVTHQPVLDPTTGDPVLRITPSTIRAAKNDPFAGRLLDHMREQRQQLEQSALQKMERNEPLTEEERLHVEARQAGALPSIEQDLAEQLVPYAYSRIRNQETFRPDSKAAKGRAAAGPKFTLTGGSDYAPEVIGGTGAGGSHGMTALAASDPLKRVKADGTTQDFEAEGLHPRYIVLKNGRPGSLINNNSASQRLRYIKPQLYATTSTGNVVSPTNPGLLEAYKRGNRQPLLDWVRAERERDPKLKIEWHFLAAPAQRSKLTVGNDADAIYKRLRAADSTKPDDVLHATARKMAEQESASFLIPYKDDSKRQIDAATNGILKEARRRQRMQKELDYFNQATEPRSPAARTAPRAAGGPWAGQVAQPAPKAAPAKTGASTSPKPVNKFGFKFQKK